MEKISLFDDMVNIVIFKIILENQIAFNIRKYSTLIIPKKKERREMEMGNENKNRE